MKPAEKSNQKASDKSLANSNKLSPTLKSYFEARNALLQQYNLGCFQLKEK